MKKYIFLIIIYLSIYTKQVYSQVGSITTNQIFFDEDIGLDLNNLEETFLNVSADLYFSIDGDDFLLLPGTTPTKGKPAPSILMKNSPTSF